MVPGPSQCVNPKRVILVQYYTRMQKPCGAAGARFCDRHEASVGVQKSDTAALGEAGKGRGAPYV